MRLYMSDRLAMFNHRRVLLSSTIIPPGGRGERGGGKCQDFGGARFHEGTSRGASPEKIMGWAWPRPFLLKKGRTGPGSGPPNVELVSAIHLTGTGTEQKRSRTGTEQEPN